MVREVITLQIGKGGNNLGNHFWDYIRTEHGLDTMGVFHGNHNLQLQYIDVFFQNADMKMHYPRTILVATDERMLKDTLTSWRMYNPEFQCLTKPTANVFTKGLNNAKYIVPVVLDKYRSLAEKCDSVQAVQLLHSFGGGTGSAVTGKLLQELHDMNGGSIPNVSWSIFPSPVIHDAPATVYNNVLSMPYFMDFCNATFCIDNQALSNIAKNVMRIKAEGHTLNYLVALAMAGVSASLRFPGQQNSDWRKMIVNLVPDPKLHFLLCSFSPLSTNPKNNVNVQSVIRNVFSPDYYLTSVDTSKGRYLASALFIRGRVQMYEVDSASTKKDTQIVKSQYIPDSIFKSVCDIPPPGMSLAATLAANNTAIHQLLSRQLKNYKAMLKKKAFMHWYEGLEENDFLAAAAKVENLVQAYTSIQTNDITKKLSVKNDEDDW